MNKNRIEYDVWMYEILFKNVEVFNIYFEVLLLRIMIFKLKRMVKGYLKFVRGDEKR